MPITLDVAQIKPPRNRGQINVPWYSHWSDHPSNGLTPSRLASLLTQAEQGDMTAQAELYEDIADKDPSLVAVFDNRKLAVLSKPWEVIPVDDSSAAKKQADRRLAMLEELSTSYISLNPGFSGEYLDFESLASYLLDAQARGFSAAVPIWDTKTWSLVAAKQFAQKHFIAADINKQGSPEFNPYELRLRLQDNLTPGAEIKPYEFLIHWYRGKSGYPSRMGLLRSLTWWYLFKNYAMKSWMRFAETYGMPLRVGKYDANTATVEDISVLEDAVKNLGQDAAAVMTMASEIEIVPASGGNVTGELYQRLLDKCDDYFAEIVLGHRDAMKGTPNKLGAEDTVLQTMEHRVEADARALERTINQQIIDPVNVWQDGKSLCYFKIRYEPEEDKALKADLYGKVITFGLPVAKKHLYETFDIPEPSETDEILTPPNMDPLMAALGGSMGASMSQNTRIPNAAASSRSSRKQRKARAMRETDTLADKMQDDLAAAYAVLVDGLTPDESAIDAVRDRKDEFIAAFEPVAEAMITQAMEISGQELGVPNVLRPEPVANKIDPFKVRNINAIEWLRWHTFSLTQIEGEQITLALMQKIRDALVSYEAGLSPAGFFARVLDSAGVGKIGRGHLQTVLRTNIATARSAATEIVVDRNRDMFPAWEYVAVIDSRTRDEHAELDGKVFAANDRKYYPPLGFNCRCEGSWITSVEMEDTQHQIVSGAAQEVEVPKGFGSDARTNYARWVDKQARENPAIADRLTTIIEEVKQ